MKKHHSDITGRQLPQTISKFGSVTGLGEESLFLLQLTVIRVDDRRDREPMGITLREESSQALKGNRMGRIMSQSTVIKTKEGLARYDNPTEARNRDY